MYQRTHQRPVYQSPYCYMMVRCSAVLMWRLAIKGLVTTTLGMQAKYDVEWDSRICRMQK